MKAFELFRFLSIFVFLLQYRTGMMIQYYHIQTMKDAKLSEISGALARLHLAELAPVLTIYASIYPCACRTMNLRPLSLDEIVSRVH